MAVLPVTATEVTSIITNFIHNSPGWDSISAAIIKVVYPTFIGPLTYILDASISEGVFPSEMKLTKVIPLFKANDPMSYSNYRPVSVLPLFSRAPHVQPIAVFHKQVVVFIPIWIPLQPLPRISIIVYR